jgi:phosphohistidine phosphatase SixA
LCSERIAYSDGRKSLPPADVKWLVQIYLLRHGIAENSTPDSDRALTPEGREKLRRVLARARDADVAPSLILSSPYRRALETAEIAAPRPRLTAPGSRFANALTSPPSCWPVMSP